MGEVLEVAEDLWNGKKDTYVYHPFGGPTGVERLAEGTWFHKGFANSIVRETGEGLILVDPSGYFNAEMKYEAVRSVTAQRLHTAIITHGHTDHAFGISPYCEEAGRNGWPFPRVIAHEAMRARFRRYLESRTWNAIINLRQFRGGTGDLMWPEQYVDPDVTYSDRLAVKVGGVEAHLRHARGETDDHTWIYFPDTRLLCTGDLFIWGVPNAGNPQKVQRYALEWAVALRKMAGLEPEILAPGHGFPIVGAERVARALLDTAAFLESLHDQTLSLMNRGASLDEVIHGVRAPAELTDRPYLQPIYDEPEFIVRNIWRLYGGWYDGTPSNLKPAPQKAQAEEIARLSGGAVRLAERAEELLEAGDLRLACHLVDWAHAAAPDDPRVRGVARRVYTERVKAETSTMAMGIYLAAAREMGGEPEEEGLKGGVFRAQSSLNRPTDR